MKNTIKSILALALVALCGVAQAVENIEFTAKTKSKPYDGTPLCADYEKTGGTFIDRGLLGVDRVKSGSVSYSVNSIVNVNESTDYTITSLTITGPNGTKNYNSKYKISYKPGRLTIDPAEITSATLKEPTTLGCTGKPQTVTVQEVKAEVKTEGGTVILTLSPSDYDVSGNTATEPGEYTATVKGKGNFKGEIPLKWTIKAHEHKWSYATSTEGNAVKLTATCTNPDCTLEKPYQTSATLTLSSGDKTYDGQLITATLAKDDDFETLTGITLGAVGCPSNATDAGPHTFSVSAAGTDCDFSKTVTISKRPISDATITLSGAPLYYTAADQTVTIKSVKVGNLDVDYTEDTDSVHTAKEIGKYTVKITAKADGNFTGSASTTWDIVNTPTTSGGGVSASAVSDGLTAESATSFTVLSSDSKNLYFYDANTGKHTWRATIKLTYVKEIRDCTSMAEKVGYAKYSPAVAAKLTVDGTTYTMDDVKQAGGSVEFEHSHSIATVTTEAGTYRYKSSNDLTGSSADRTPHAYYAADTISYRVEFSLAEVEAAIKGNRPLTWTINAGAIIYPDSAKPHSSTTFYSVAFKDYTVTVPVNETGYKLYDNDDNQVYPPLTYVAQNDNTKKKFEKLADALSVAAAGQTVNAIAACEKADFTVGKNVTLNLGSYGNAEASYVLDADDSNMKAKVISTKEESVSTVDGFAVIPDTTSGYAYTVDHAHVHAWNPSLDGSKLTIECKTTACDVGSTYVELVVTKAGSDGVAPELAVANWDTFKGIVNKYATIASVGSISISRLTDDGASKDKWYVGDYRATCVVTLNSVNHTLTKDFTIDKPAGGWTEGNDYWVSGLRDVRYRSWDEARVAAKEGDTIYYYGTTYTRNFNSHTFDFGARNVTLDFRNRTLSNDGKATSLGSGTGTLTFKNVIIKQPGSSDSNVKQITTQGNIVFGSGVVVQNRASDSDDWCTITCTSGKLTVLDGLYQCKFLKGNGDIEISGGYFWYNDHCKPSSNLLKKDYIVRETKVYDESSKKDVDFYQVVYHEHHYSYSVTNNVIYATCDATDHAYCGFGTKTATLNAPNKEEDGQPYQASIAYSDGFPDQTGIITYYSGETQIDAPTAFGSYIAKTTIGGVTAVKAFEIIHNHHFEYDADQDAGTITARCTTTKDCDLNKNPRVATLNVQNGTYTGAGQDLAATSTNTDDFPANVVLTYSVGGDVLGAPPANVGTYTATMTVGGTSVTKNFSIAKASMGDVAASMTAKTLNFTGAEQQNTLGSATLGSYNLQSGDYELSGVRNATGSGYSNCIYQVTLTGKGDNFTGSTTIEWTIVSPTGAFADNAMSRADLFGFTDYATVEGKDMTVTDTTRLIYGGGQNWFAGATIKVPNSISDWSSDDSTCVDPAYLCLSWAHRSDLGIVRGSALPIGEGQDIVTSSTDSKKYALSGKTLNYVKSVSWFTALTPAMVEQAAAEGKVNLEYKMTAGALVWDYKKDGLRFTDYSIKVPLAGFTFALTNNASCDIGATVLSAAKIRLAAGSSVTTTAEQAEGKIYTEVAGYQVYKAENAGTYTYTCVKIPKVTIPDVTHATKVVKVGDTVIEGVDNVYTVNYGDTVTVVYTPATGYETAAGTKTLANVTADAELADLPTISATNYAITYDLAGGTVETANPESYTIETPSFKLNNPTKAGYTFGGWKDGTDANVGMSVEIAQGSTGARAFTATWNLITYDVVFLDAATYEAVADPMTYTVETGASFELPSLPARDNCSVAGWLADPDGADADAVTSFAITPETLGYKTYYARYAIESIPASGDPDAPIVSIPQKDIDLIVDTADKSTDEVMAEMTKPDAKGITKIERYVLGLKMDDVDDVPVIQPVQTSDATTVRVNVANIAPLSPAVSGAEVRYSIETSSTPDFASPNTVKQQPEPTFDLPLPESGVRYYRAKIDLVKPE